MGIAINNRIGACKFAAVTAGCELGLENGRGCLVAAPRDGRVVAINARAGSDNYLRQGD